MLIVTGGEYGGDSMDSTEVAFAWYCKISNRYYLCTYMIFKFVQCKGDGIWLPRRLERSWDSSVPKGGFEGSHCGRDLLCERRREHHHLLH